MKVCKLFARALNLAAMLSLTLVAQASADVTARNGITVSGYRLLDGGTLSELTEFSDSVVTVSPTDGLICRDAVYSSLNQNTFKAEVAFGYKLAYWLKLNDDEFTRGVGEAIDGSEGALQVTIPYDETAKWQYLAPVIEYDNARTLTVTKSKFGEGTVTADGAAIEGSLDCEKGDKIELIATPAHNNAYGVDLSKFVKWSDGCTESRRTVEITTNLSYMAIFEPSTWRCSFDAKGGTVEPASKSVTCGFPYGALPTPTRAGYEFQRWAFGDTDIASDSLMGEWGNHSLSAIWAARQYAIERGIIRLDYGDGAVTGAGTYDYGAQVELKATAYAGSAFLGWVRGASWEGGVCDTFNPYLFQVTGDETYSAVFTSVYYQVEFEYCDERGITRRTPMQSVRHGTAAVAPAMDLVTNWVGHVFYGWDSSIASVTADHTGKSPIKALYDCGAYVISYDANGGERQMADQLVPCDSYVELSANLFTRKDYYFLGWSSSPDGSEVNFGNCDQVINLAQKDGSVTLYAVWAKDPTYVLRYEPNPGDGSSTVTNVLTGGPMMTDSIFKYGEVCRLSSNSYGRVGYEFTDWQRMEDDGSNGVKVIEYQDGGAFSLEADKGEVGEIFHLLATWTPITYTLKIDINGGTYASEYNGTFAQTHALVYDVAKVLEMKVNDWESLKPADGYKLMGFSWDKDAESPEYVWQTGGSIEVLNQCAENGGTVTLYAIWRRENERRISFNTDGGSEVEDIVADKEESIDWPSDPTREGYVFAGWADAEGQLVEPYAVMEDKDVELTAQWIKLYTLSFDTDGGSVVEAIVATNNAPIVRPADPVREGYRFAGWYNGKYEFIDWIMPPRDTTLTAKWEKLYAFTLDPDNGEAAEVSTNVAGAKLYRPLANPEKSGYVFLDWYEAGADLPYAFTNMPPTNVTVRAWWARLNTLSFDTADGTAVKSIVATNNAPIVRPADPVREGYRFAGWYDGDEAYGNWSAMPDGDKVLTAKWNKLYVLTFDSGEGTPVGYAITNTAGAKITEPENPVRAGYDFDGWYTNGVEFLFTAMPAADVTLKAQWAKLYTATFDAAPYGTPASTAVTARAGTEFTLPKPNSSRANYGFVAWADDQGKSYDFGDPPAMPSSNLTLKAVWEELTQTYKLTYVYGNGTGDREQMVLGGGELDAPDAPVRDGYRFAGWYTNGAETAWVFDTMPKGDLTLIAHWDQLYVLKFDSAGGSAVASITNVAGESISMPADPSRENHVFDGWSTNGVKCALSEMPAADLTLKAEWKPLFVITFDSDGGSAVASITNVAGAAIELPTPTRAGFDFAGWYDGDAKCTGLSAMPNGSKTLTAKWKAHTYGIYFDGNGADGDMANITATNSLPAALPKCSYTNLGYAFYGWTNSVGEVFADQAVVTDLAEKGKTAILYAKWGPSELSKALFKVTNETWPTNSWLPVYDTNGVWQVGEDGISITNSGDGTLFVIVPSSGVLNVFAARSSREAELMYSVIKYANLCTGELDDDINEQEIEGIDKAGCLELIPDSNSLWKLYSFTWTESK